jgi:hypothetical protein
VTDMAAFKRETDVISRVAFAPAPRVLSKRRLKNAELVKRYPAAKSFHAPQREHVKQPMPPGEAA